MLDREELNPDESTLSGPARGIGDKDGDELERIGRAVFARIQEAAGFARMTYEHALDTAQDIADQLATAQARVKDLETQSQQYRERAERAEEWLARIQAEIEQAFLQRPSPR
jgi:predicted  nucleic acid-binding Zn-ribbon protein